MKWALSFCTFDQFQYILLGLPALVLLIILFIRYKKMLSITKLLAGSRLDDLLCFFSLKKYYIKMILYFLGLLLTVIVCMRPQWNEKESEIKREGRDVLVALDISRSMLATDTNEGLSRLNKAKEKTRYLANLLGVDRMGIILFSGYAYVHCPFTSDQEALNMFLDTIDVEAVSSGTTSLEEAIKEALKVCQRTPDKKTKLLVIFTDGEDFSQNLSPLKSQAQEQELKIVAVGVGTSEGSPIPLINKHGDLEGHLRDTNGSVVISRLNEEVLQSLTNDVGGFYIPLSSDNEDMRSISRYLTSYEKEHLDDFIVSSLEDHYSLFALGAFVCFFIEWLL